VREVYILWFDVHWNSDLQLPCSNMNLGKHTYFQYRGACSQYNRFLPTAISPVHILREITLTIDNI
jgi:hypothetical protein